MLPLVELIILLIPNLVVDAASTINCGQPEVQGVRIIAGTTAIRGSWPWQVLMLYNGHPACGGSLISPQWVVTAAHCVNGREWYPQRFTIRVGEYDRRKDEGSEVDIQVGKLFRHRNYDPFTTDNDIALFRLSKPVTFNKYVSPVCLPSKDVPVGTECYITGWGKTKHPGKMSKILQQGKMTVVKNNVCAKLNRKTTALPVTKAMVCAGDGGKTPLSGCHGDSGGPFVCKINGKWELHGAVSHGTKDCDSKKSYSIFTRIFKFKSWIEGFLRANP